MFVNFLKLKKLFMASSSYISKESCYSIFDDLFMKFMENISDEAISFQEYKAKWEQNKRYPLQNISESNHNMRGNFSNASFNNEKNSNIMQSCHEEFVMVPLEEFIQKHNAVFLSEFQNKYDNCILFRIQSKSMIILTISITYFKSLMDNRKEKEFEEIIKRLEFFKYQVSRTKQIKIIEIFKNIKTKLENKSNFNPLHEYIHSLFTDKVFREGVIDLVQEIIVDLILNNNYHHIIQSRNIELKRFILQLRNSKNEEEMLTNEFKTLISQCFRINFNISIFEVQTNSISKETFSNKIKLSKPSSMDKDIFTQNFFDFFILKQATIENASFLLIGEKDYQNHFLSKIMSPSHSHINPWSLEKSSSNSNFLNKENFERRISINCSNISNDPQMDVIKVNSPQESLRKGSFECKTFIFSGKKYIFTLKKVKHILSSLHENLNALEKMANL